MSDEHIEFHFGNHAHEYASGCPWCGRAMAGCLGVEEGPKPGDISVCWSCAQVAVFTTHGLRRPEGDEIEFVRTARPIQRLVAVVKAKIAEREAGGD